MRRRAERQRLDQRDAQREARLGVVGQRACAVALSISASRSGRRRSVSAAMAWARPRSSAGRGRAPRCRARPRAAGPCAAPRRAGAARRGASRRRPGRVGAGGLSLSAGPSGSSALAPRRRRGTAVGGRTGGGECEADLVGHRLERGDPVLGGGMGREQAVAAAAGRERCRARPRRIARRDRAGDARPRLRASLASAEASARGLPQISAPPRSAPYSRVRLIASWTIIAANGATITASEHRERCCRGCRRRGRRGRNWRASRSRRRSSRSSS